MVVDRSYVARNQNARARLEQLATQLGEADLQRPLGEGWTVAAALAHLAFWDRYALAGLQTWQRMGHPPQVGEAADINAAGLPVWLAISGREAAQSARAAAEAIDRAVEDVPAPMIETIIAAGRPRLLDRSLHRNAHLDDIERVSAVTSK